MLRAILNKSWQQHPTRHQLYGHLPPITKTIQVRRTRHAGHCWRSRDELIRDVLLWIPTHGRAKAGRPARTYIQQLCEDTGCCPEDLPRAMNDREEWRERVRDIRAASTIWWWWWYKYLPLCASKMRHKWRLTSENSKFSWTGCYTKTKEFILPNYLPIAERRIIKFISFLSVLTRCKMKAASSRIWTRDSVFLSYDGNHYTTDTLILGKHKTKNDIVCIYIYIYIYIYTHTLRHIYIERERKR